MKCQKCGQEVQVYTVQEAFYHYDVAESGEVDWENTEPAYDWGSTLRTWCGCGCGYDEECPYYYDGIADKVLPRKESIR